MSISSRIQQYGHLLASSYKTPSLLKERLIETLNLYAFFDALMAFGNENFDPVRANYAVGAIFMMQANMFINTVTSLMHTKLESFMKVQATMAQLTMLMLTGTMLYMHYDDEQPNFVDSVPPKVFATAVSSAAVISAMKLYSDLKANIARNLTHLLLNMYTAFAVSYGLVLGHHKEEVVYPAAYAHLGAAALLSVLPLAEQNQQQRQYTQLP